MNKYTNQFLLTIIFCLSSAVGGLFLGIRADSTNKAEDCKNIGITYIAGDYYTCQFKVKAQP